MRKLVLAAICVSLLSAGPLASVAAADPSPRVYVVVIDGLEGDKVEAGAAPFISSLLDGQGANATYFPESSSVLPAETNPNHTAMMSGAFSGDSGIAGNAFGIYAPLEDEETCVRTGPFDFSSLPTLTSGENSSCPEVQFTWEAIKEQGNPHEQVSAVIMGKPKLGLIFSGGHQDPSAPGADYVWSPCDSDPEDDRYCEDVATNPITGYAIDDRTVMDEVLRTIRDGVPVDGAMERPDLTFVNLPQVDSAGHATGTGPVYDAAIGMADAEIERLVTELRDRGEWKRSVLVLLSDHGMEATPQKISLTSVLEDAGIDGSRFTIQQNGSVDMVYLADRTSPGRFELLKRMREAIEAEPGVAEALYREPNPVDGGAEHTVATARPAWNSDGERSGDIFVTSTAGVAFSDPSSTSNPLPGNHGSPNTADNFLAVVGGSNLVRQGSSAQASADAAAGAPVNVDVASTVMGALGLFATEENAGEFLGAAFRKRRLGKVARPIVPRVKVKRVKGKKKRRKAVKLPKVQRAKRKVTYRLNWSPDGGSYDIDVRRRFGAVRKRGNWKRLERRTERGGILVRGRKGQRYRFRIRARSAADVPGRWRRKAPKLR